MSKRILVCGSVAFDYIAVFEGNFKDHILIDHERSLSVSFFTPSLDKFYGGCAGNIAYNLNLLGSHAIPVVTLGKDGQDYLERFQRLGIDTSAVKLLDDYFSAQCFITTDLASNQVASFHPGAMIKSADNDLTGIKAEFGIVAPDSKDAMFTHAERLHAQGIPFVFDLGQAMPLFEKADLERMIELCTVLTSNDYEASVISQRVGLSLEQIASRVQAFIVTEGEKGSTVYADGHSRQFSALPAVQVVDPTGCGDAHRAGLLHGLTQGWSIYDAACLGSVMGGIKIAHQGTQNHAPSKAEIQQLLQTHYGITQAL